MRWLIGSSLKFRLLVVAIAAVGIGVSVWRLQGGVAAEESLPGVAAIRGDIVVSVGGVGRIVEARASGQIGVGGGVAASAERAVPGAAGGGGVSVPANAVFSGASGRVSRFLVAPGERVAAGRPLAVLDDGGSAAAAVEQARNELATALLELRQKRTRDPLRGLPPTPAELTAGRLAVTSARARLARLLGPARAADVSAAWLEVKRAEADLEALRGGTPAARAKAVGIARNGVLLARQRLARILAPPGAADVSAVEAELRRAEAELAALLRAPPSPLPEALAAAEQAVAAAQQKLAKLTAPPDPVAVAAAQLEVKKAEADLAFLLRRPDPPMTLQELQAAQHAVEVARLRLAKVLGPPDPAEVGAAQLELSRARAELAALTRRSPDPSPQAIAAAEQAVDAARLKRAKLLRPPIPAEVTAARLELKRAQAELRTLEAGPSRAALAAARQAVAASRARLAQLRRPPLEADVTAARLDVRRAEAELAVLRARGGPASPIDVDLAGLKVKAAWARLAAARSAARLLVVRAPFGGTVTALLSVRGAPVDASTPIATVADLDHLAVSVDLSEFDAARVRRGLSAVVGVDALGGKSLPGKVLFVAPTGSDTGGVVTFPVRVRLARAGGLKPGMNVSVRIIVAQRRKVVQVPLEAVSRDEDDRPIVEVIDASGEPSPRRVRLGLANNKNVEIVRGLRAGERVLLAESQAGSEE